MADILYDQQRLVKEACSASAWLTACFSTLLLLLPSDNLLKAHQLGLLGIGSDFERASHQTGRHLLILAQQITAQLGIIFVMILSSRLPSPQSHRLH